MEYPPACRRGPPPPPHGGTHSGDGIDYISGLPDEVLLIILARLDHHRDAVRTSVLSHRWRVLTSGLSMVRFSIHHIQVESLPSAIRALGLVLRVLAAQRPAFGGLRILKVCVPAGECINAKDIQKVLFAASEVSPVEEFSFILPWNVDPYSDSSVGLPGFHRTISVELHVSYLVLELAGHFPVLERLTLTGCLVDIDTLVRRCPRLRVLKITSLDASHIVIHSDSLQELHIQNAKKGDEYPTESLDIIAPALKYLTISIITTPTDNRSVSMLVPMVEKISWECGYSDMAVGIGTLWRLMRLNLKTGEGAVTDNGDGKCLSLYISACETLCANAAEHTFEEEIHNLPVGDLCTLELYIYPGKMEHAWRSIVLHILGIDSIRTATRRLKLVLQRSEVEGACTADCPCHEPTDWSSQITSLINLEEVQIKGFGGEDYEVEFLKMVSRAAPLLAKTTQRQMFRWSAGN